MRALVTGAGGFIASHLVHRLLKDGHQVTALIRYRSISRNPRLADVWGQIETVEADIRNRGELIGVSERWGWQGDPVIPMQVVFHLAAFNHVGDSWRRYEECFDVNAKGTANLLEACHRETRFVYMSTSEVYGNQPKVPWTEDMQPMPASPYGVTKYAGELYCQMAQRAGRNVVILRCFNVFGPSQSEKALIPELITKMLKGEDIHTTKGEQTREYNYIDDTVEALVRAGTGRVHLPGAINICNGQDIPIRSIVDQCRVLTATTSDIRYELPYRPNEIWRLAGDNSKAKAALGWEPKTSFEEGLKKTVAWFKEAHGQA